MICRRKNCAFEVNTTTISLGGKYCCVKCKESKGHGAFCKKILAKCCNPSCDFKCHPDFTISCGTHCCNACRLESGHGSACKSIIYSNRSVPNNIVIPEPLISFTEPVLETTNTIFPENSSSTVTASEVVVNKDIHSEPP